MFELLIGRTKDLDALGPDGEALLHVAAQDRDARTVSALLSAGANLDVVTRTAGATALMIATEKADARLVKLLLNRGAAVDVKYLDSSGLDRAGLTALLLACQKNAQDVASLLVRAKPTRTL